MFLSDGEANLEGYLYTNDVAALTNAGIYLRAFGVGNYSIEFVNEINNTNWLNLTNIALPFSPYLFIDTDTPNYPKRFYRALLMP